LPFCFFIFTKDQVSVEAANKERHCSMEKMMVQMMANQEKLIASNTALHEQNSTLHYRLQLVEQLLVGSVVEEGEGLGKRKRARVSICSMPGTPAARSSAATGHPVAACTTDDSHPGTAPNPSPPPNPPPLLATNPPRPVVTLLPRDVVSDQHHNWGNGSDVKLSTMIQDCARHPTDKDFDRLTKEMTSTTKGKFNKARNWIKHVAPSTWDDEDKVSLYATKEELHWVTKFSRKANSLEYKDKPQQLDRDLELAAISICSKLYARAEYMEKNN
jgi:hypothetical protein